MQISRNRKQISDERFSFHQCRKQNRIEHFVFGAFFFCEVLTITGRSGERPINIKHNFKEKIIKILRRKNKERSCNYKN